MTRFVAHCFVHLSAMAKTVRKASLKLQEVLAQLQNDSDSGEEYVNDENSESSEALFGLSDNSMNDSGRSEPVHPTPSTSTGFTGSGNVFVSCQQSSASDSSDSDSDTSDCARNMTTSVKRKRGKVGGSRSAGGKKGRRQKKTKSASGHGTVTDFQFEPYHMDDTFDPLDPLHGWIEFSKTPGIVTDTSSFSPKDFFMLFFPSGTV